MIVIVAGGRNIINPYENVCIAVKESGFIITELLSGEARGIDTAGEEYAQNYHIDLRRFKPDWERYGRVAGFMRNTKMAEYAFPDGGLVAIWDGISKGTKHMINEAKKKNLKIFIWRVE